MAAVNFSGLASGIDSEALIKATSEATRSTRVTPHENKITELEDTNQAFDELKAKFTTLQDKAQAFTTLSGGAVSKQVASSDETVLTASAGNAAADGIYNVTVTGVAKNGTCSFASTSITYASGTQAIAPLVAGTETITVHIGSLAGGSRETVNVPVTSSTTLSEFVTYFNNNSTEATASLVNVGSGADPDYIIMINGANSGIDEGEITYDFSAAAVAGGQLDDRTLSQATNATFTVDGIVGTITRQSNTISDLLPGLTFEIAKAGTSRISVSTDPEATISTVQEFIDAYNDIVNFLAENDKVERQEDGAEVTNIFGPLAKTTLDNNALQSVRAAMTASSVSGTSVAIFADLGITTERDGTLKFDSTKLKDALTTSSSSVKSILQEFGDTVAVTGGTIDLYIRFNGLFDSSINSNKESVDTHTKQMADAEKSIARTEESLRARFAALEALMSKMQSQQSQLTSALAGLG